MSCTLAELAEAKNLTTDYLSSLGLTDTTAYGQTAVEIPYLDKKGNNESIRYRLNLTGNDRFRWKKDSTTRPYGRWIIDKVKAEWPACADTLLIVEGESDCWAAWMAGYPCLGLPGATNTNCLTLDDVTEFPAVYVWQEPDKAGKEFPTRVKAHLTSLGYTGKVKAIKQPPYKDISELYSAAIKHGRDELGANLDLSNAIQQAVEIELTESMTNTGAGIDDPEYKLMPRLKWDDVEAALNRKGLRIKHAGGGKYMAQCPAHDDSDPSLSITVYENGDCWMKCQSQGCGFNSIVKALGLEEEYESAKKEKLPDYLEAKRQADIEAARTRNAEKKSSAESDASVGRAKRDPNEAVSKEDLPPRADNYGAGTMPESPFGEVWKLRRVDQTGEEVICWVNIAGDEPEYNTRRAIYDASQAGRISTGQELASRLREIGLTLEEAEPFMLQYQTACEKVEGKPDYTADEATSTLRAAYRGKATTNEGTKLSVEWFTDIEQKTVEWLWTGYLPTGKLVCIYGPANEMKTTTALDLAARITTGKPMPDGSTGTHGRVAVLTSEDSAADTLVPRFLAAGGDPTRICKIDNMVRTGGTERFFNLAIPELRVELENRLRLIPDLKLLFIDPISSYLGATDSHRVSDVRGILSPLSDMADRLGITILYVNHVNKCSGQSALHRASGSTALIDACRVAIFVGRHPDDPEGERRVLTVPKHNLTRKPQSMVFSPEDAGGTVRIKWGGCTDLSADDLLTPAEVKEAEEGHDGIDSFLRELLKDGAVEAGEGLKEALTQGYTKKQIRVARERLGVQTTKPAGVWHWSLPKAKVERDADEGDEA